MSDDIAFVKMFDSTGSWLVAIHEEPRIDAAVERWLSSGGTANALLSLTLLDGSTYKGKASDITSWYVTFPADRARCIEIEKELEDERQEFRRAAGIFESE